MNNLPPEVLHFIFIQLPLRDRLNCTLVCRHWYKALRKRSLLYDLEISRKKMINGLIDLLHCLPRLAIQVEVLKIKVKQDIPNADFDYRKFSNMFPNLRVFINMSDSQSRSIRLQRTFEFANPESKLEVIEDCGHCELTRELLKSAFCTRLKTLKVHLDDFGDPSSNFFTLLKNVPVLESLSVVGCAFGILDIEMVHNNVPSIKHLVIDDATLESDPLPDDIKPATSVTKLELRLVDDDTCDPETCLDWYEYVSIKYTNLNEFLYNDDVIERENDIDFTKELYQSSLIPLYKNIGVRLKRVGVRYTPADVFLFDKLDGFGCQLQRVDFRFGNSGSLFSQLARSNQSNYVQEIYVIKATVDSPSLLSNMTSLRSLHMKLFKSIDLTEYINAFPPSLTELEVNGPGINISALPDRLNNIEILTIARSRLPSLLGQTISTCFPKLVSISLEGGINQNMKLHLPNNHLKQLHIVSTHERNERKHGFILRYANGLQTFCFIEQDDSNSSTKSHIGFAKIKDLENRTIIEVECASTNEVTLKAHARVHTIPIRF